MLHLLLGILLSLTSVHGQSFFKGDVDGDEEFTRSDVERAVEVILGSVPSDENTAFAADFNDDGNVDALDVVGMLNLLEERPQTVVVEPPEGMDVSGMVLLSGPYEVELGSAKPVGKRKYELKLGRPEVPRIIMALDKSGDVAFLGIQTPYMPEGEVNVESTAEDLIIMGSHLFSTPPYLYPKLRKFIRGSRGFDELVEVLKRKLKHKVLVRGDAELESAIRRAVEEVKSSAEKMVGLGKVTPSDYRSGVKVVQPSGELKPDLEVRNKARRWISLYIYRDSPSNITIAENHLQGPASSLFSFKTLAYWFRSNREGLLAPSEEKFTLRMVKGQENRFSVHAVGPAFKGSTRYSKGFWCAWGCSFADFVLFPALDIVTGINFKMKHIKKLRAWTKVLDRMVHLGVSGTQFGSSLTRGDIGGMMDALVYAFSDPEMQRDLGELLKELLKETSKKFISPKQLTRILAKTNMWIKGARIASVLVDAGFVLKAVISSNKEETFVVTIPKPKLVSIEISPTWKSLYEDETCSFTAVGVYSDGSRKEITSSVTWRSSDTSVGTISSSGVFRARSEGTTTITASKDGVVSNSATVRVRKRPPRLVSIEISPTWETLYEGETCSFTAVGIYSDGSRKEITSSVTWRSSNTSVGTISSSGVFRARSEGTTTITASWKGVVSNEATVKVKKKQPPPPPDEPEIGKVRVSKSKVTLRIWDYGKEDGDIITVIFNGKTLVSHLTITNAGWSTTIELLPGKNWLQIIAENEGTEPPNTAAISISDVVSGEKELKYELNMNASGHVTIEF